MATVRIRAGAPPGQKAERLTGQGEAFEKHMGLGTLCNDTTVFTCWAADAARRCLRRMRAGSRWPSEVVS